LSSKSKHSITLSPPNKVTKPDINPAGDQKTETSLKTSTNTISIKSFSIKKIAALKPVLIGTASSKKQKIDKTTSSSTSELSSGPDTESISVLKKDAIANEASVQALLKSATKLIETLPIVSKIESFDVIAAPPKVVTKKSEFSFCLYEYFDIIKIFNRRTGHSQKQQRHLIRIRPSIASVNLAIQGRQELNVAVEDIDQGHGLKVEHANQHLH